MAAICGAFLVERKFSRKRGRRREHMERGKSEMSCSTRAGMFFLCFIDGLMLEDTRNNCSDFCGLPCIFVSGCFKSVARWRKGRLETEHENGGF